MKFIKIPKGNYFLFIVYLDNGTTEQETVRLDRSKSYKKEVERVEEEFEKFQEKYLSRY